jgi:hypothetical protein
LKKKKKKKKLFTCFMLVFDTSIKISPETACHRCSDMLSGMLKFNPG